jgi:hypothetical protein
MVSKKLLLPPLLLLVFVSKTHAVVIDEFSVGDASLQGPTGNVDATSLDASQVIGGARRIELESPVNLTIADGRLLVEPTTAEFHYFTLVYGFAAPLGANFTADGHDRLRLTFGSDGSENAEGISWVSINSNLPPSGSAPGPGLHKIRGGAIIELPLSLYNTDLSNVSTFGLQVVRMRGGFSLESITTAGPPFAGDFDRDGVVGAGDLVEFRRSFGKSTIAQEGYFAADANLDRRVDGTDFLIWQRAAGSASVATVPEPMPPCQFIAAATAWLMHRRRSLRHLGYT